MRVRGFSVIAVVAAICAGSGADAGTGNLYRYRNYEGVLVIDDSIPPEFVGNGYEILSPSGMVLEKVTPQPEAEEAVTPESRAAVQQQAEDRQREDRFILRSYSKPADVEAARRRKLDQIRREIEIVESNITDTRARRVQEQARAANYQRGGREVPAALIKTLDELDRQEQQAIDLLALRKREYAETERRYERYLRRLKQLQGVDEARREARGSAPQEITPQERAPQEGTTSVSENSVSEKTPAPLAPTARAMTGSAND